jgi:monofunctional biosynthetic peptidoglycan transglycosylase
LRRLRVITASLLVIPAIQVVWVAWASPRITGPVVVRTVGGWFASQPRAPIRQQWLALDAVPSDFLKALLIVEDGKFFEHDGFSWNNIRISLHEMIQTGQRPRGASTITQQCARSLFLWQGRSWIRKGLEAYYTFWMELILSKKRILELYVNVIELGEGVYGLEAGARHHFAKGAAELTRDEIAALAALLPAPRVWNPREPNTRQRLRQEAIVKRLEHTSLPLEAK